jgi:hypothetical protein
MIKGKECIHVTRGNIDINENESVVPTDKFVGGAYHKKSPLI